jgi:hypothetical protein
MKCPSCGSTKNDSYEMKDVEKGVEVKVIITYCKDCQTTLNREVFIISNN